jgi:hypothetical protein
VGEISWPALARAITCQLQIVVHMPAMHCVVQNCGRADAWEIGEATPANIAMVKTNTFISVSFWFVIKRP